MKDLKSFTSAALKVGNVFLGKMDVKTQEAVATAFDHGHHLSVALEFDHGGKSRVVLDIVNDLGEHRRIATANSSVPVQH